MNNLKEIKTYFDNGKISQHYFINENNKKEGKYNVWWNNGQQLKICYYKNGILEGKYNVWYNNGQQLKIRYYKNGLLEGEYTDWNTNGNLSRIRYYKKGERFGICLNFRYKNNYE